MLQSMTGYGQAAHEDDQRRISVEVKSINAKQADVSLRLPSLFSAQEPAWRNWVIAQLGRGKITLTVSYTQKETTIPSTQINQPLFKAYYKRLQMLAEEVGASTQGLFQLALHGPEVVTKAEQDNAREEDEKWVAQVIQTALQQCTQSRSTEGAALTLQLTASLQQISQGLAAVERLAPQRVKTIRARLEIGLLEAVAAQAVDQNRLEQELIYYIERLDIAEETVRLAQHLAYFKEVMASDRAAGKKLGFIAQEIGREINTIGAKANDVAIQKEVILMKDELEKIKEQLHNIL
ncbi:MAG: YicC/YloC family endoribonuclease [Roseivirga sp.]